MCLTYACLLVFSICSFFSFHHAATPQIYTLSLHDALPISTAARRCSRLKRRRANHDRAACEQGQGHTDFRGPFRDRRRDRKSTRLNSSHLGISYAVFCLKKKNKE